MPIGKDIYDSISKKINNKKSKTKNGPAIPPEVHQYTKNKVTRAKSNNVHIIDLAGPRSISKNEGMPAVNGKSGQEVVEKTVAKIPNRDKPLDVTAGAIETSVAKEKKCGRCHKTGHNRRNCPLND